MTEERLAAIEGKLDKLILVVEANNRIVDGFDDRQAQLENTAKRLAETERHLATTAVQLSVAKVFQMPPVQYITALIFSALLGGCTAVVLDHHFSQSALHSSER